MQSRYANLTHLNLIAIKSAKYGLMNILLKYNKSSFFFYKVV